MISIGRLMPVENHRKKHTLRAVVIEHTSHTDGMWWWQRSRPSLKFRLIDEDFSKLSEILQRETTEVRGYRPRLTSQEFEVGFEDIKKRDEYTVSEEIEVLFSTACGVDQFFTGAQPFRWDGIQKKPQLALVS